MKQKSSEIKSFYRPGRTAGNRDGISLDGGNFTSDEMRQLIDAQRSNPLDPVRGLRDLGVDMREFVKSFDALPSGITTPSISTPLQFLQAWLPGFIHVITAPRNIDLLVGRTTIGSWEDKQIVFSIRELTGEARPYGDYTNIPLTSWNVNQIVRTIVNQEQGIQVGKQEALMAARMNLDDAAEKRDAAALQLEIVRNAVGFYGYNAGLNLTYGFLNDPNELPYTAVSPKAAGGTSWANGTYLEITSDIRTIFATVRTQSKGAIDPQKTPMTMALPTAVVDYLTVTSQYGNSVQEWLTTSYPNVRVENAPELNGALGGQNVVYVYADEVNDSSTDDRRTFIQAVPTIFMALGVLIEPKAYTEDYSNATAGTSIKRPYALSRWFGV